MNHDQALDASCFRYVVPFQFDLHFENAVTLTDGQFICGTEFSPPKPKWLRVVAGKKKAESDLYNYIRNETCFDSERGPLREDRYGCSWLYYGSDESSMRDGQHIFELRYFPNSTSNRLDLSRTLDLSVRNVGLTLYRNGIGLIWYEIKMPKELRSDEVQLLQYRIRELNREIWFWRKVNTEPSFGFVSEVINTKANRIIKKYLEPFSIGFWINQELSFLSVKFIAERRAGYANVFKKAIDSLPAGEVEIIRADSVPIEQFANAPDKAVLFTYVAFSGKPTGAISDERVALAFHLANGYKNSYHCSSDVFRDMAFPFDDMIWYATQEGAACLVWPRDDNRQFFTTVYPLKIIEDYFTLFLKTLFQSYSMLLYANRIQTEISADAYANLTASSNRAVVSLYAEINVFLMKSMATSVSHIHHQSAFYNYLNQQLRILDDVNSVTAGLASLDAIQREQRQREEARRNADEQAAALERYHKQEKERLLQDERQKKRDNQLQAIMGLFALLGIASALMDCFDFIGYFENNGAWYTATDGTRLLSLVLFAVIGIISCMAICFSVRALIEAFTNKESERVKRRKQK